MRVAPALALALVLAGCGDGGDDSTSSETEPTSTSASSTSPEEPSSETSLPSDHFESRVGPKASTTVADLSRETVEKGYAQAFPDETDKTLECEEAPEAQLAAEADCTLKSPDETWGASVAVSALEDEKYEVTYLVSAQATPIIKAP